MKELSIEEKAKRYDEAKARMSKAYNDNRCTIGFMNEIFPELKESEDEKIRQFLIHEVTETSDEIMSYRNMNKKDILTWLEKQGSEPNWCHHKVDLSDCSEEYRKAYYDGWNNCNQQHSQCNAEQKSADKVIEEEKSLLEKFKQAVYDCAWGKVTCKVEGESKEEYANRWAEHFLFIVRDWADDYIDFTIQQKLRNSYEKGKTDITEKQGEQKPAEWKQDNVEELTEFENVMMHIGSSFFGENAGLNPNDTTCIKEQANLLLELVPKQEWSEDDTEMLDYIIRYIEVDKNNDTIRTKKTEVLEGMTEWLKSLKDMCIQQPEQEWSDDDAGFCARIQGILNVCKSHNLLSPDLCKEMCDWLKSLRPQNRWKPSDEQMFDLKCAADLNRNVLLGQSLLSLYNDLKKLRGK